MRKLLLVAGIAAAALLPSLALAQPSCDQRDNRPHQTVAGRDLNALLGVGPVYGDCAHAYGYYDRNSQWHANSIDRADARGYFDRDGAWVAGPPNGYYDDGGRWVTATADPASGGYYDGRGRWIPASANGYYDETGQWVISASGHYDGDGRWIAGQTTGAYDANGRWMPGARNGHTDAHGVWIADAQPGYYDERHQWRAGPARGYYDTRGVWIGVALAAETQGADVAYQGDDRRDVDSREAWLEQHIQAASASGALNSYDSARDLDRLASIRSREAEMRGANGQLAPQDQNYLQERLDRLSETLRASTPGGS